MEKNLDKHVITKIMDKALVIHHECPHECRDFRIMASPHRKNTLILRWTTINLENPDKPAQCFHYECFNPDGSPQNCSINYDTPEEANEFFWSLKSIYQQDFAADHKMN